MKIAALVLPLFVLGGCSSLPPKLSDDTGLRQIDKELADVLETTGEARPGVPSEVTDALLPPLDNALDTYDPSSERFDVSVKDLPAREFFQSLVKDTPYNMVVSPEINGAVTLDLKSVTVDEVLHVVRDLYGYDYKKQGSLYRILPGGMRTEVYQLNYLNIKRRGGSEIQVSAGQVTNAGPTSRTGGSTRGNLSSPNAGNQQSSSSGLVGTRITTETDSDFWSQLDQTLSLIVGKGEGRAVVTTPDAGMLVVRAMPDELRAVEEYLRKTELIMQRQVVLEARILEVILNEGHDQGIDWAAIGELSAKHVDASGNPTRLLNLAQTGQTVTNPGLQGVFSAALQTSDFSLFIDLLSTQGNVQVLSSPRIATVNNQKAVIKVGSDEFFVTEIRVDQNNNINSSDTTNTDVELTPFFSGIALDVTPQISEEGRITLHVHPSVSEVSDQTKVVSLGDRDLTLPLAFSTIRETDSIIGANNGQVVVIGGLIRNVKEQKFASVPGLGRLPVVGNMFRQKQERQTRSELVILIRPMVADAATVRRDIAGTRERFGGMSQYIP
ncbi:MAG: pilus (MSHA type) biogenesis protein MshL [Pseudomonadales bacterium]|nr:pilus (MSHA type) biogenesis protein MshL [Pseudomonadales bacterium]